MNRKRFCLTTIILTALAVGSAREADQAASLPNPFYAMDTAFGWWNLDKEFTLIKQLGYAGIAWHDWPGDPQATAGLAEKHGLKMFTIYCLAMATPEGDLWHSAGLSKLMKSLKGYGTIVWLHIGGRGPAIDQLTGQEALVKKLRALADIAAANDLRVAIYPHVGEWTGHFGDATRLAKLVSHPKFGVTFNLCHCLATGDEKKIPALLEAAKPVLFTVTISGADAGVNKQDWSRQIQTLDKGTFDVGIVLRKLKEIGFTGPIGFQGYGIHGDTRSILAPTMEAWKKLSSHKGP